MDQELDPLLLFGLAHEDDVVHLLFLRSSVLILTRARLDRKYWERKAGSGVVVVVFVLEVLEDFAVVSGEGFFGGMAPLVDKFKI